jgi:tRNA (guanine-N7-)-methyltransferase
MEAFLPFYGRRKGRPLRNSSKHLLEELLPAYLVPDNTSDPAVLFTHNPRKLFLEIGFGGGEHLAMVAKTHPENAFIGADPFLNGVSCFLKYCQNEELKNVRIWPDDVRLQLSSWPNECLDGIFIMFPDPWPKTRHSSRRIINKENLAAFARLIKVGGSLRMASDHASAKKLDFIWSFRKPLF